MYFPYMHLLKINSGYVLSGTFSLWYLNWHFIGFVPGAHIQYLLDFATRGCLLSVSTLNPVYRQFELTLDAPQYVLKLYRSASEQRLMSMFSYRFVAMRATDILLHWEGSMPRLRGQTWSERF